MRCVRDGVISTAVTANIGVTRRPPRQLTAVAHNGRLPRAPLLAADRWRPLGVVGHGGCLANRRSARRLVDKSAKLSNGRIILQNDIYIYIDTPSIS
jgi:hypothetical protein